MPEFHKILRDWYKQNKRDLPWRTNNLPYYVWVSEIILQQTRVAQGTNYFIRFVNRFPDVESLAVAPENEVLKIWQGLGYYSRARNMHKAALQVVNEFHGNFPDSFIGIQKLKGIGSYTAAAIASISFGLPHASIDGNVYRVLSRIFGIATPVDSSKGKKEFNELANQLIDRNDPGTFNEAMMEFGALQCTPRNPDCNNCPFQSQCIAFNHKEISKLPVKANKTKVRHRYFNYMYIKHGKSIYLEKRAENDIWQNMYQLPLIESPDSLSLEELFSNDNFTSLFNKDNAVIGNESKEILHILSHQKLHVRFIEITLEKPAAIQSWIKVSTEELEDYPLPKPVENFLNEKNRNHPNRT